MSTKNDDILAIFTEALSCDVTSVEIIWVDDFSAFAVVSQAILTVFLSDKAVQEALQQKVASLQEKLDEEARVQAEELRQTTIEASGETENLDTETASKVDTLAVVSTRRWEVILYSEYLESKLAAAAEARLSESGQSEMPFKKVRLA